MASSTSRYGFNDEEVPQLANCTDQAGLLHVFRRILNTKIKNQTRLVCLTVKCEL